MTKIPNRLFSSGMARTLKPSATLLYVALCDHANRKGSNTFKASDNALSSDTTLSPRTICDARKRLIGNELITCTREEGQSYFYTLVVPSWNWVPVAKRPRSKLNPRLHREEDLVRRLPLLFRTLHGQKMSSEALDKVVDLVRESDSHGE